jgi:hypothetical protein
MSEQEPELMAAKVSATLLVPQELLDDYADTGDLIGRALRGEIQLKPIPAPRYHRCLFCWLLSLLPGHDRCEHGRLYCDDCISDHC